MSHSLSELSAVITEKFSRTTVLLWRNGGARLIFGMTGSKLDAAVPADLDAAIHILTGPQSPLSASAGLGGQVNVYRVPAELTTDIEVLAWLQSNPDVHLEFANEVHA